MTFYGLFKFILHLFTSQTSINSCVLHSKELWYQPTGKWSVTAGPDQHGMERLSNSLSRQWKSSYSFGWTVPLNCKLSKSHLDKLQFSLGEQSQENLIWVIHALLVILQYFFFQICWPYKILQRTYTSIHQMYPTELTGDGQNYLKGHCCFSLTARYIGHANDISVLWGALCRSRLQE